MPKYYDQIKSDFLFYDQRREKKKEVDKEFLLYYDFFQNEKTSVTEQARVEIQINAYIPLSQPPEAEESQWIISQ